MILDLPSKDTLESLLILRDLIPHHHLCPLIRRPPVSPGRGGTNVIAMPTLGRFSVWAIGQFREMALRKVTLTHLQS